MKSWKNMFNKKKKDSSDEEEIIYQNVKVGKLDQVSLDNMSPEELIALIHKYDKELKKQSSTAADTNSEEIALYREHSEQLNSHIQKLTREYQDLNKVYESKMQEVDILRGQITELDAKVKLEQDKTSEMTAARDKFQELLESETTKVRTSDQELQNELTLLKSKVLQIPKLEQNISELNGQLKLTENDKQKAQLQLQNLKENHEEVALKYTETEKKRQEIEVEMYKKQIEYETTQREVAKLQYQRDSAESERNNLKENLAKRTQKLHKKHVKLDSANANLTELTNQLNKANHEIELASSKHSLEISKVREEVGKELGYKDELSQAKMQNVEKDMREMAKKLEIAEYKLKDADSKTEQTTAKDTEIEKLKNEIVNINSSKTQMENENTRLQNELAASAKKRELAKNEVLRLEKRLQNTEREPSREQPTVNPESSQKKEPLRLNKEETLDQETYSNLMMLKMEFEGLYKELMNMMMTCSTQKITGDKMAYVIATEEFSHLERRLNNAVMQTHEAVDTPEAEALARQNSTPEDLGWKGKIYNAVDTIRNNPVKIFS